MRQYFFFFSIPPLVVGHGFVQNATIGGKEYDPPRISREIQGNFPIENVKLIDLECGGNTTGGVIGSRPAPLHAPATAGSTVNLRWTAWPESHQGPVITYMARCPDTGCNDYVPSSSLAQTWFKIAEDGLHSTDPEWLKNHWGMTSLINAPNAGVNYTIPACLRPGFYLVRHEIIALHSAYSEGGAQFYPGCHQLEVTGDGSTVPTADLVSFPGAYDSKDAGLVYSIYNQLPYEIPGPKVFQCVT
ncbi:hypothetical protein AG0111_0g13074 [Alternaria gaisen]|uniref:Uncharacterized protein n=1 Tax=Alternaria gaisen TaxID=167740 RepID=A0ACB6F2X1_9PLEO|nr:hypothetical protein AG0111_0g13074 [Alternaria gaisen]